MRYVSDSEALRAMIVSILYWRCRPRQLVETRLVATDVSILYWRCSRISDDPPEPDEGGGFNSLLEMHVLLLHRFRHGEALVDVSILYWRCRRTRRAAQYGRPVSILYWRCFPPPTPHPHLLSMKFQFSIGDARLSSSGARLRTSSMKVSILYWRCYYYDFPQHVESFSFNSLLEMPVLQQSPLVRQPADVSILYWRCSSFCRRLTGRSGSCFNSLLEMLGFVGFWMCGFLSFLCVFWRGGV